MTDTADPIDAAVALPSRMVTVRHPEGPAAPLVLDSPHSGRIYPEDFGAVAPVDVLRAYEDRFVDDLVGEAPAVGATLVEAHFSRAYVDPNRAPDDLDEELFETRWPDPVFPSRHSERGVGLVFRLTHEREPIYDRRLAHKEVLRRVESCWRPYHDALELALDRLHGEAGAVWHLNCHSMRPWGDPMAPDPGARRADFVLGDRDGESCEPAFTDLVAGTLRGFGYSVALNDPYKGAYIVERHGRPAEGRHSLQIEINRALYLDLDTLERGEGFERVRRDMGRLTARLAAFAARRARES